MPDIIQCKLTTRTSSGKLIRSAATLEYKGGRIWFLKSPFSLKDEIKAMKGSRWHGRDDDEDGRKIWSIEDCSRNRFQLGFLMGEDVYAWFDRELIRHDYSDARLNGVLTAFMPHQCDLSDSGLTYHYQLWAAEMGTGKTLSAQKVIEKEWRILLVVGRTQEFDSQHQTRVRQVGIRLQRPHPHRVHHL